MDTADRPIQRVCSVINVHWRISRSPSAVALTVESANMDQAIPPRSFLPDSPYIPRDRHQHWHRAIFPDDRRKSPDLHEEIRTSAATAMAINEPVPAVDDPRKPVARVAKLTATIPIASMPL